MNTRGKLHSLKIIMMCSLVGVQGGSLIGPYQVVVNSISECPNFVIDDRGFTFQGGIYHNKSMKMTVLSGNFTLKNHMGHVGETLIRMNLAKWDSVSGWRPNFLVMDLGEMCAAAETFLPEFMKSIHSLQPTIPSRCPFKDGVMSFDNFPMRIGALKQFPQMPYGRFRADVVASYKKRVDSKFRHPSSSCIRFDTEVTPKLKNVS